VKKSLIPQLLQHMAAMMPATMQVVQINYVTMVVDMFEGEDTFIE